MGELPELPELPKVYIWCAAQTRCPTGCQYLMQAVAEDGTVIAEHSSDHPSFAVGDLHNQRARHAAYHDRFGGWGPEFYQLVVVPHGEELPAELMQLIRERNAENQSPKEKTQ